MLKSSTSSPRTFYLYSNNMFPKALPGQDVTSPVSLPCFTVCRTFLSSSILLLLYFSHNLSNWSSPPFSRTTFHHFYGIYDLFSYVSNFQHHTKLCSNRSISLNSSLSPICWTNGSLLVFYKRMCMYMYMCVCIYIYIYIYIRQVPCLKKC
jgi:hypothetical protein